MKVTNMDEDSFISYLAEIPNEEVLVLERELTENARKKIVDAKMRGQAILESVTLTRLSGESVKFNVAKDITGDIKRLLESHRFAVFGASYLIREFLAYGVKINVVDDVQLLVYTSQHNKSMPSIRLLGMAYDGLSTTELIITLLDTYSRYSTRIYKDALKVTKLCAYGDYFDPASDTDEELRLGYLNELHWELDEMVEDFEKRFGTDIRNRREVHKLFEELTGVAFKLKTLGSIRGYDELTTPLIKTERLIREVRALEATRQRVSHFGKDYRLIASVLSVENLPTSKLNIVRINPSKNYYLSIDAKALVFRYLDRVHLGVIVPLDVDYHAYCASLVYKIPVEQITKEQRRKVKLFNFYRLNYVVRYASNNAMEEELRNKIDEHDMWLFKRELPIWKTRSLVELNILLVKLLANVYDALGARYRTKVTFFYDSNFEYAFRVSNKVNPYELMLLLGKALDTTKYLGFRLFNYFNIETKFGSLIRNPIQGASDEEFKLVGMDYKFAEYMYSRNSGREFRNIVGEVRQDFNTYCGGTAYLYGMEDNSGKQNS